MLQFSALVLITKEFKSQNFLLSGTYIRGHALKKEKNTAFKETNLDLYQWQAVNSHCHCSSNPFLNKLEFVNVLWAHSNITK